MCRSGKRFWPIRPSCLSNRGPAIAAALRFRPSGLVVRREFVEQVYRAAGGQMLAKMCCVPPDRVCRPSADVRLACGIPPRSCQHGLQPDPVPARNVAARVPTVLRHRVCLLRGRTSRNWPGGFVCQRCCASAHCMLFSIGRPLFQCHACRRQTSLTAGTLLAAHAGARLYEPGDEFATPSLRRPRPSSAAWAQCTVRLSTRRAVRAFGLLPPQQPRGALADQAPARLQMPPLNQPINQET